MYDIKLTIETDCKAGREFSDAYLFIYLNQCAIYYIIYTVYVTYIV